MGRKTPPVNEKAVEAKEKKALDKFVKEQRAKKQEEDAMWREAGEGKKTKAQAKREQLEAEVSTTNQPVERRRHVRTFIMRMC
mmetsp:Transcript_10119/g.61550  ORF Transcript_10119/g.61550 Transcript_10119/m.61550 type:complete len:83 (-) Transcript_10119:1286-1534(-)